MSSHKEGKSQAPPVDNAGKFIAGRCLHIMCGALYLKFQVADSLLNRMLAS